jgi:transcriptional regulator with XRE-family HTH domain
MTHADIAKAIGVSSQQFQIYETGKSRVELSRLFEICRVFDRAPSEILLPSLQRQSDHPREVDGHELPKALH